MINFLNSLSLLINLYIYIYIYIITFITQMGRFFNLVDTPEHKEDFKRRYNIPSNVSIDHCKLGEWHENRPTEAVAIPMIVFIEAGMRIPMGR